MADEGEEQAPVRVPLALSTTPRNADLTKDALLQNCFIDGSQMGNKYAVKRPGFYVGSEAITTGLNRGIYVNPNNPHGEFPDDIQVWYIPAAGGAYLSSFYFHHIDYPCYSGSDTYHIGDVVRECPQDTPHYAVVDGLTGIPPTGSPLSSDYWSPSPPGATRYRGNFGGFGPICATVNAAGVSAYQQYPYKSCSTPDGSWGWITFDGVTGMSIYGTGHTALTHPGGNACAGIIFDGASTPFGAITIV